MMGSIQELCQLKCVTNDSIVINSHAHRPQELSDITNYYSPEIKKYFFYKCEVSRG